MRVLIIGGTGLISTAISRFLIGRGDDVTLYNRGITEARIPNKPKRILGDRTRYATFETQMTKEEPFDCVIDMVCFLPEEAKSAIRAFQGRVRQYIFCSTMDVYTKPAKRYPIKEDEERQPSSSFPYAVNKAACENILLEAQGRDDFPLTIIRPAYTYGEGRGLIHTLGWGTYYLDRVRKGKPIIVHGDGTSFWVACHRDDLARAFVGAVGNTKAFGKAYHVTGDEWMTWDSYHQGVAKAMAVSRPRSFTFQQTCWGRSRLNRRVGVLRTSTSITSLITLKPRMIWAFATQSRGWRAFAAWSPGWMNTQGSRTAMTTPSMTGSLQLANAWGKTWLLIWAI
ncbi:MAG: NAD-dependent epimerase/dehydratase family protein [Candidatus Bathyarchaeota archaeon]|nr:NAD-dependent epimerase/dehydratase family protein [Candidatus Bathyarchaeota archaeon]